MTRTAVETWFKQRALGGPDGRAPSTTVQVTAPDLATVYSEHAAFVWRTLRGMGVSESAIEDAVQDVFTVVHRKLAKFDGQASIRTWLFAIVYRVALEQRRRLRRHPPWAELVDADLRDWGPTPHEQAERNQALDELAAVLDGLDVEKRAVLILADVEGLSVPEIAEVTGIGLNTAYTRLRRARLQFEKLLRARRKGAR